MKATAKIGLFPGTFDPITYGHLDVIRRGRRLFDELIVAIGQNPEKRLQLFSLEERLDMVRSLLVDCCANVKVETYHGLTVDYAKRLGAVAILRGIRNISDLNFELQVALTNRTVADVETVFIMTNEQYGFTSSSLIRQIAACGEVDSLHRLLPPLVLERLKRKKTELGDKMLGMHVDVLKE